MIWTVLLNLLGVHILGMASPGLDPFLILRLTTKSRKHVIAVVAGISTGTAIRTTLTILGFATVVTANPLLMEAIRLVGGHYLIYMGIGMAKAGINTLRELCAGTAPALESEALRSPKTTFRQSFFANISNPEIILFLTAVLSQLIPAGASVGTLVPCTLVLVVSQIAFSLFIVIVVSVDAIVKRVVLAGPWIDTVADTIFLILGTLLVASGAGAAL